ncbi:hypothetical protein IW262DRAFT_1292981 [Armillaria fumosa]|nr:hypothetical protein IW262DRAFT_1292981 [Armillaria fumosa]
MHQRRLRACRFDGDNPRAWATDIDDEGYASWMQMVARGDGKDGKSRGKKKVGFCVRFHRSSINEGDAEALKNFGSTRGDSKHPLAHANYSPNLGCSLQGISFRTPNWHSIGFIYARNDISKALTAAPQSYPSPFNHRCRAVYFTSAEVWFSDAVSSLAQGRQFWQLQSSVWTWLASDFFGSFLVSSPKRRNRPSLPVLSPPISQLSSTFTHSPLHVIQDNGSISGLCSFHPG